MSFKESKQLEKKIEELVKQQHAIKQALAGFELTRVAHGVLLNALSGGLVEFYQGSTDEIALRCIAIAKSLIVQLDNEAKGAVPEDAVNAAAGALVGAAK